MARHSSISFLLGAGFSAPAGYPIGKDLNYKLYHGDDLPCEFHTSGSFVTGLDGKKPNIFPKSTWQECWEFGLRLMKYYESHIDKDFDYEKFYDYIQDLNLQCNKLFVVDEELKKIMPPCFVDKEKPSLQLYMALNTLSFSLTEVVSYLLIEPEHINLSPYSALFNHIKEAFERNTEINIHSLNHDELIENLITHFQLNGNFTDGFEKNESPYYAVRDGHKESLEVFTNNYHSSIRLYKLHGGIKYYPFFEEKEQHKFDYADYVKRPPGFDEMSMFSIKDGIQRRGTFLPESDILIGENYKKQRYEGKYFNTQLQNFSNNLKKSDILIIIGYAFRDPGINEIIRASLSPNTKCIVIDKYWNSEKNSVLQGMVKDAKVIELSVDSHDIDWKSLILV